jgi:D-threonate/D-erythronate kinase
LTPELRIAIVADDLTGALDAIAPFANAGLRCIVAIGPHSLAALLSHSADVIAVSTNSRELPEELACSISHLVAESLAGIPRVIKKIDSRLKGQLGVEIGTLARRRGLRRVLLCPAIPGMGRVVNSGLLQGFGLPHPVAVADVMSNCSDLEVVIPDLETDAQFDQMLTETRDDTLLVGARGLTAALARRMAGHAPRAPALPLPRPLAFAIGSRDPITLAQVNELQRNLSPSAFLAAPNGVCVSPAPKADVMILQATPGETTQSSATVTGAFAESVLRLGLPARASLVLSGGETAAAVLALMQVGALQVLGEAFPGIPLCRPLDFPNAPLILTKSGGFGAYDALSRLL